MTDTKFPKHLLTLENRKVFSLTGVTDIECSNESMVRLNTSLGKLIIYGKNLSIGKISVDTGDFSMTGDIDKIEYKNSSSKSKNLSSLFR